MKGNAKYKVGTLYIAAYTLHRRLWTRNKGVPQ